MLDLQVFIIVNWLFLCLLKDKNEENNPLTKKPNSCWIAMKHMKEIQPLALGPFYSQVWFYSWAINVTKCITGVFTFFFPFLFGHMEVPKEMECDTPREGGTGGAYELEKARSSRVPSSQCLALPVLSGKQKSLSSLASEFLKCVCVHKGVVPVLSVESARENSSRKFHHLWD